MSLLLKTRRYFAQVNTSRSQSPGTQQVKDARAPNITFKVGSL